MMRPSVLAKTTIASVFLLLAASLSISRFGGGAGVGLYTFPSSFSRGVVVGGGASTATTTPFADIFPDKNLVLDLVRLNVDIYNVDKIYEDPKDAISNDKFKMMQFIRAEVSTEVMVLSCDTDETYTSKPIVVFRGTEDFQDAMADGKLTRVKSKFVNAPEDVFIHRGFQKALFDEDIVGQVEEKILEMAGESGEVIISGHSLGGATAHIMAVYLADKYPDMIVTMINIGAPRFGNEEFKLWSEGLENLASWRYVFRRDIVPRIIPKTLGYHHSGHLFQVFKTPTSYHSVVYYRQVGNGEDYAQAPYGWYCKY